MAELDAQIGLTADASGVEAGVGRAKKSLASLGASATKMGQDVAGAGDKAGKALSGLGDGGEKSAKKIERDTKSMQSSIQRYIATLEAGSKDSRKYWETMADFKGVDKTALRPLLDQLDRVTANTKVAKSATSDWRSELTRLGPLMASVFSGAAMLGFGAKLVAVQREFDVLNSSLKTVTGSSANAEREMAWLKDFAKETPFGLAQATQGFVKMKALGLDPTRASLTSFGNTASAMGKDLNQMIEAVADASTGEFERLKEFGIKAKKEGDNVSLTFQGVTTTIKNSAAEITAYLEQIGNNQFGGAMEERARTLDGAIAGLGDTWDELFRTVNDRNAGTLIHDSVKLATGAIEDATTILRAMTGAANDNAAATGAMSTIQNGIATVFETVAALGANLSYVLQGVGREIGGLAAQVAQAAQFNFAGVSAIREQMVADAEAARREIDATTARILNARKAQEEYARWATRNASAATDPRRVDLGGGVRETATAAAKPRKAAIDAEARAYENLIKTINTKIAAEELELAGGEKLTDSQRLRVQFAQELQTSLKGLSAAKVAEYTADLNRLEALERENTARKEFLQIAEQERQQRLKIAQAAEQSVESLTTGNQQLRDEIQLIGLSATEQMEVIRLREEAVLLVKEQHLAEMQRADDLTGTMTRERIALEQEIELRRERLNLMGDKATKEQFAESNREMTREWQRTVDQYGDIFRQGFADMLNNGKDGWKSFTRSLVTTFKTTVADAIYKMFAQPFVVNIVGNLMGITGGGAGGQAVQASGGGSGIMGMASNASSAYNLLTGGATGAAIASSLGGAAISLGNLIGSSAVTSFGAGMAGATLAPGLMGPTTIGATGAMGAGAGLGSTLAAIPGWGWALAGIGALFGGDIVSGLFGRKHEQRNLQGTFGGDSGFEGRWEDYYKGGLLRRSKSVYTPLDEETRSGLGGQFVAMRAATAEMAETLGLGTSAISNFTASVNIKLKGLSAEDAQKKIQEEFDKIAESLAGTALGTDRFTRSGESSVQTLTRLSGSITAVNSVLEHLNGTFFAASLAGADMASQLVDLFGDAGAFTNATAGYFQNFYSAGEQRQASRTQLERQLAGFGVSMPDIDASNARAQWRALADAQDLTTASGRKTWAMLIQLSGAFAGLTQSIDEVIDKAFSDLQSATNRQLDGLQQQRNAVQESLSLITGIFDLVRSNARELYGEVADTASMQAAQGMEFVRNALTVARSTGVLPEQDALNEAIQAARSGISQAGYASQFDADFARLSLAGQLSELGDISGRQKTFEEQQLAALDAQSKALQDQLSYWEEQIAILRGTAVATWDIGEAVRNLAAAIGSAKAPAIPAQPEAIPMPKPVLVEEPAPVQQTYSKDDLTARQIMHVSGYDAFGPDYYGRLARWLKKKGISTDQAAYVLGMSRAELLERFASVGIPAFAAGGMHSGGLRVVGERGWELEATGPARIWNQQQLGQALGGGNAELIAEMRALRQEVAQLKSINAATASNTSGLPQMVDQFDNVTEGGNAMRQEAIA